MIVPLQGLRNRAQDVVISVLGAADDDDHRGFRAALAEWLTDWDEHDVAAFGQLVSRFNQSTSRTSLAG